MGIYVAFLRAINLGATRKFPQADIVTATEVAGFVDVDTHINTGNVRLATRMRSVGRIEAALERAYLADRGFEVPTLVYSLPALTEVIESVDAIDHDGRHYVALLRDAPTAAGLAALRERLSDGESIEVCGRAVSWLVGADGVHGTKLTNNLIEKCLGTVATTRSPTVLRAVRDKWGTGA
ncbi:DUF1697 domain-containing protein [Nocardioides acrostichi]|uniref:DUF1697 domain-containing protein n=1 Tax=Nocardioides acrostichi TaxID=2784339 RepID=A0A930USL1_9ACTN|nr:DUF1697 domain-containing protein [Nocardioides acrostichi]MBF4160078.1 DUF1697 domain-containing protein [Nocardioides acrostichi]